MSKIQYGLGLGTVIIIISLLFGINHTLEVTASVKHPLEKALLSAGIEVKEINVNGWSQLPSRNIRDEEMEELARQALGELGFVTWDYKITHHNNLDQRLVRGEASRDGIHGVAMVQVPFSTRKKNDAYPYLVINIDTVPREGANVSNWQGKIAKIITSAGGSVHLNTCLVGWLDGKLEKAEWDECFHKAFTAVGVAAADQAGYPNLSNYSGYSPAIEDYLMVGDKKTNINMAMRYSPYDNRTYIIVGSPVITKEY